MGIFVTALRNEKIGQIFNKNTPLYFRCASRDTFGIIGFATCRHVTPNCRNTVTLELGFFRFLDRAFGNAMYSLGLPLCSKPRNG